MNLAFDSISENTLDKKMSIYKLDNKRLQYKNEIFIIVYINKS